jgi:bisanhydrobacterioruberin hydratase
MYWVGILGVSTHNLNILKLTPISFLLTWMILNLGFKQSSTLWMLQLVVFVGGYFIEVIGVNTGLIFGQYKYLNNLGIKIMYTPLIMGVNWVITVFCCYGIISYIGVKNLYLRAAAGSILMVLLDLLIEPVCELMGFWEWQGGHAPVQNFVSWMVLGFMFQWLLLKSKIVVNNQMSLLLYILQMLFFGISNIYLS